MSLTFTLTGGSNGAHPLSGLHVTLDNGSQIDEYTSSLTGTSLLSLHLDAGVVYALRDSGQSGHIFFHADFTPGTLLTVTNATAEAGDAQPLDVQLETFGSGVVQRLTLQPGDTVEGVVESDRATTRLAAANLAQHCLAESTRVRCADGSWCALRELKSGAVLLDHSSRPVEVQRVVVFRRPSRQFVNVEGVLLCRDHPILENGLRLPCQLSAAAIPVQLPAAERIVTLITRKQSFLRVGEAELPVGTWSTDAWANSEARRQPHYER